jgi:hypothetical protein
MESDSYLLKLGLGEALPRSEAVTSSLEIAKFWGLSQ